MTVRYLNPSPTSNLGPSTFPVSANAGLWTGSSGTIVNFTYTGPGNANVTLPSTLTIPAGNYVRFLREQSQMIVLRIYLLN